MFFTSSPFSHTEISISLFPALSFSPFSHTKSPILCSLLSVLLHFHTLNLRFSVLCPAPVSHSTRTKSPVLRYSPLSHIAHTKSPYSAENKEYKIVFQDHKTMGKSHPPRKPPSGRTNLASCIVATIFLIFLIIIIFIVYFTIFKPKNPTLTVNAINLPAFSVSNSTVNFTFSQYATVNNPNRAVFTHYDSSLQILYAGTQVGFMFIPAGKIDAGKTQYMAATFSVQSFPLSVGGGGGGGGRPEGVGPTVTDGLNGFRVGPSMEVESRLEMAGRVRVLHFFTHHVETSADCRVSISVSDGSVLGFHC